MAGSEFRERLRRLRREQGDAARAQPPARRESLPAWLQGRLRRGAVERAAQRDARKTLGPPAGLVELEGTGGPFAVRDTWLEVGARHGEYALGEARAALPGALRLLTRGGLPEHLDVERAVFLDIETTGLSGGAGTHPFLVGLGWFEGERLVVRQAFLRGPEEERALLAGCAERLRGAGALVSFFGKSFDRHRLEDKMRLFGVPPPFEGLPHADLYWPCRRLYGAALPDTRLATMERALCGFERSDDLPGAFAPAAWFDFLGARAHLLEEVFRHNLHDVLSLVTLLAHLGRVPREARADGAPLEREGALACSRARALAELHLERKEPEQALEWSARARERADGPARGLSRLEARALKRLGRREEALERLLEAGAGGRDDLAAECLLEAAVLAAQLGWSAERVQELTTRGLELARVTTTGTRRARLEREAQRAQRRAAS